MMLLLFAAGLLLQQGAAPPVAPRRPPAQSTHQPVMTTHSPAFLAKRVLGVWEQTERSEDGLGITLRLSADGSAVLTSGIVEDLNYNFDGEKLIVVDAQDPDDVKQISNIELTGDHLKETNTENGLTASFIRVSAPVAGSPLAGEWKRDLEHLPPADAAAPASETDRRNAIAQNGRYYYKPDGRLFVRIPLSVEQGRWDISPQGKLEMQFGAKRRQSTVEFDEDEMVLKNPGGTEEIYRPADY